MAMTSPSYNICLKKTKLHLLQPSSHSYGIYDLILRLKFLWEWSLHHMVWISTSRRTDILLGCRSELEERFVYPIVGLSVSDGTTILLGRMSGLEEWSLYHSVEWVTHARHYDECTEFNT
jgi:hypothetical protein